MNMSSRVLAAALLAAVAPLLVAPAAAGPTSSPLGLRSAVAPTVEIVQYRRGFRGGYNRGGYRGGYGGAGVGLGFVAGALIGGALLGATQPYGYYRQGGYDPGYGYAPDYDQDDVVVAPAPYAGGGAVAYCQQRFRSYDPGTGTYLGFDGLRHPCP